MTYKFTHIGPKLLKLYRRFLWNEIFANCYTRHPNFSFIIYVTKKLLSDATRCDADWSTTESCWCRPLANNLDCHIENVTKNNCKSYKALPPPSLYYWVTMWNLFSKLVIHPMLRVDTVIFTTNESIRRISMLMMPYQSRLPYCNVNIT